MAGERCDSVAGSGSSACRDVNPGSFHVILANQIGLLNTGFVAEVSRDAQIWNQPVYGFSTSALSQSDTVYTGAAPGTRKIVEIETTLQYIAEAGPRELDAGGDILRGEWRSTDHPDFFWTQGLPSLHGGQWAPLRTIYAAAHG